MSSRKMFLLVVLGSTLSFNVVHAQSSPVGLWRTVDDNTQQERSWVRIVESQGVLSARIEKLADASLTNALCEKCTDDRKNQPIVGLEIIRNITKSSEPGRWDGGTVLDPANGKVYKARLTLVEGGKKLDMRGYVGTPALGRTQTWLRAE